MGNELKQKANEFYAREIWLTSEPIRVYINHRRDLFTRDTGDIFIGQYDKYTEGVDFFLDVIRRLREYTKDYACPTSMQNLPVKWEE